MQTTMHTLAAQAHNSLNSFALPISFQLDDAPDNHLKVLIISRNMDSKVAIFSMLDDSDEFDAVVSEADNFDSAVRKVRSKNYDLTIFEPEGWTKYHQKRLVRLLESANSCPLIIASQDPGSTPAAFQQSPHLIDLRYPDVNVFKTVIFSALYTYQMEQQLNQVVAELQVAEAEKSRFLAHMSHDLKTPLNAIIGFSDAIKHGIYGEPPSQDDQENLHQINAVGTQLLGKINQLIETTADQGED